MQSLHFLFHQHSKGDALTPAEREDIRERLAVLDLVDKLEQMMLTADCYMCEVWGEEQSDGKPLCPRCQEVLEVARKIRAEVTGDVFPPKGCTQ